MKPDFPYEKLKIGIGCFFTHATEDKNIVREIYLQLKKNGIEPWLDEINLPPRPNGTMR
ncbi:MAG: toll/interleukin-1 receptor domain-containing protein [Haliscomenobacter sp.]|nr:toll/interleukin-1 receptor domain-containing protein [Haliscomenobacter sp.]